LGDLSCVRAVKVWGKHPHKGTVKEGKKKGGVQRKKGVTWGEVQRTLRGKNVGKN